MGKVRIFLADWQVLFREGVHLTLSQEEDFEVVGEATGNEEAVDFIEKNQLEVAILNAGHDKPTGIEIARHIKRNLPSVAIVVLMDSYNGEQLFAALKSGADACLSKDIGPDELLETVRNIVRGEHPISQGILKPGIASRIIEEFEEFSQLNKETGNLLARLLPVEVQVLQHIASKCSADEMVRKLDTSEEMIRQHLDIILAKLVANDHNREVIHAVRSNLTSVLTKISGNATAGKPAADYITRYEFDAFKETLLERFKSFTGGPS